MIVVTGASGQLGRLVIEALLKRVRARKLVAAVRDPAKVKNFAERGVQVRVVDYDQPDSLDRAFKGASRILLISGRDVGRRVPQHQAVIDAAKRAGVALIVYTSVLHGEKSPLPVAQEHNETERRIKDSGLPRTFLRNGSYTEDHLLRIPAALQLGVLMGCAGTGRFAAAPRADYAEAAAVVMTGSGHAGRAYNLAGDTSFSLAELAKEISRHSGKDIKYLDMSEADYRVALTFTGLPEVEAELMASTEAAAAEGGFFDEGSELSALIGRPTVPMPVLVGGALQGGPRRLGAA